MGGRREMENFHRALTRVLEPIASPMDRAFYIGASANSMRAPLPSCR